MIPWLIRKIQGQHVETTGQNMATQCDLRLYVMSSFV